MSSINLMPENSNLYIEKREKSRIFILVSIFFILSAVIAAAGLYAFNKYFLEKEIEALNPQLSAEDQKINEEIKNNKLLSIESRAADARILLSKHPYFLNIIDAVQNNLIGDAYLISFDLSRDEKNGLVLVLVGAAKDYYSVASQISVFKSLPAVNGVSLDSIKADKEGYISFKASLKLDEKILFYNNKK